MKKPKLHSMPPREEDEPAEFYDLRRYKIAQGNFVARVAHAIHLHDNKKKNVLWPYIEEYICNGMTIKTWEDGSVGETINEFLNWWECKNCTVQILDKSYWDELIGRNSHGRREDPASGAIQNTGGDA